MSGPPPPIARQGISSKGTDLTELRVRKTWRKSPGDFRKCFFDLAWPVGRERGMIKLPRTRRRPSFVLIPLKKTELLGKEAVVAM